MTNILSHCLSLFSPVLSILVRHSFYQSYSISLFLLPLLVSLISLLALPRPLLVGPISYVAATGSTTKPNNKEWAAMWTLLIPLLADT